jgi:hypothetical protein
MTGEIYDNNNNYFDVDFIIWLHFKKKIVRFRIILTRMDLKPYTDPITIFILVSLN